MEWHLEFIVFIAAKDPVIVKKYLLANGMAHAMTDKLIS